MNVCHLHSIYATTSAVSHARVAGGLSARPFVTAVVKQESAYCIAESIVGAESAAASGAESDGRRAAENDC